MADYGRWMIVAAGWLVGAIAGASIWSSVAAGRAQAAAARLGEDALIEASRTVATASIAAALTGAFWGGLIGLAGAAAYLYFTNPDRGMEEQESFGPDVEP